MRPLTTSLLRITAIMRSLPILALVLTAPGCSSSTKTRKDARIQAPTPEQRFGNDTELVADFENLKTCPYREGRLDHSCPELRTLKARLKTKSRNQANRSRLITTLANLLESRRELTRLVAAENLFFFHQDRTIIAALKSALQKERVPVVKATMLRQICWTPSKAVEDIVLSVLSRDNHEKVRAEAVTCLGRRGKASPRSTRELRRILLKDPSRRVKGSACTAVGALRAPVEKEVVALLKDAKIGWRCGTALAAMGTRGAYEALVGELKRGLKKKKVHTQLVSATVSFQKRSFFDRAATLDLLSRAASMRELSWITRKRAISELAHLKARKELLALRPHYSGKLSDTDAIVGKELARVLSGSRGK